MALAGEVAMSLAALDEMTDVLAAPVFGGGLPAEVERLLQEAAASYDRAETALSLLREARRQAPDHYAVLIGLYRFLFYKGRLPEAREIAESCLLRSAIDNSLPLDWRLVRAGQAAFSSFDAPLARFFMFTLKGYAYLNLRLGDIEEGREAIAKLLELDSSDRVGARVLLDVLEARESGDVE
jgi:tetratricopeptide (TPR) repeat protein